MKTFQRWIKAAYLSASPGLIKSGSEEEGKTKPHTLLAYKTCMLDNEKSLGFFFTGASDVSRLYNCDIEQRSDCSGAII